MRIFFRATNLTSSFLPGAHKPSSSPSSLEALSSCLLSSSYPFSHPKKKAPLLTHHSLSLSFPLSNGSLFSLFLFLHLSSSTYGKNVSVAYTQDVVLKSLKPLSCQIQLTRILILLIPWWHLMSWTCPSFLEFFYPMFPPHLLHECTFYHLHHFSSVRSYFLNLFIYLFCMLSQFTIKYCSPELCPWSCFQATKFLWENQSIPMALVTTSSIMIPTYKSLALNSTELHISYLWLSPGYLLCLCVTKPSKTC